MSSEDAATGRAQSGDVSLFFRRFGRPGATPVLILHGLSFFSYDWIGTAEALAADREVVAMDMRGFGDSDFSPSGDYSLAAFSGDVIALLDHLGWREAVLMGHSMGGRNATFCTAENAERVKGLVLVDYSPENAPAGSKRVRTQVAGIPDLFDSVDAAMRYFTADPDSTGGAASRARYEAYLRRVDGGYAIKRDPHFRAQFRRILETGEHPKLGVDMWQTLGRVRCPALVVRGTRSDMLAAETVAKVCAANARIRVVEVDAGHNVAIDNPQAFLAAVRPFLHLVERIMSKTSESGPVSTRGIDHLAFVTDDLPGTMDFYTRVIGMRLVHVRRVPYEQDRGQPPYDNLRHYFFDMGNDSLLAFFEYPKGLARSNRDLPGGMQHVAFHVPMERFDAVVERVRAHGVKVVGPVSLGGRFWSAYFFDPNGIRLEFATSRVTSPIGVVDSVRQTEEEARAELETLFDDPKLVDEWLAKMPLLDAPVETA